jgi:hypothetical protein
LRAKARAIFGPAIAEPMPKQPNGAKALQQRANARPIPTYKVGGVVKKPTPTPADLAAAKAQNEMIKKATVSKKDAATIAAGARASAQEGAEMKKMKMKKGGKVQTSSDTARKLATEMGGYKKGGKVKDVEVDMKGLGEMSRSMSSLPKADLESRVSEARNLNTARAKETSDAAKKQSFKEAFNEARKEQGPNGVFTWRGNAYNTKMAGESSKAGRAAAPPTRAAAAPPPAAAAAPPPATAGAPPAAGAGAQTTRKAEATPAAPAPVKPRVGLRNTEYGSYLADILDKEGAANAASNKKLVERYKSEGRPRLAKIVSMLSGAEYAKGGKVKAEKTKEAKPKNGLAVMIAIGSPKKPAKKMDGGAPDGYAAGGAGKMRKGMMPEKFAQGGAGKVRKGMMTPEGNIINVMNKMRGK